MITNTLVYTGPVLTTQLVSGQQVIQTLSPAGATNYTTILSAGLLGPPGPPGPPGEPERMMTDPVAYYILSRD